MKVQRQQDFEAACGVVRHFKRVLRGPLWGHGKQGHTAWPQKDQPAWGHFLFSRLIPQPRRLDAPLSPLAGFIHSQMYIIAQRLSQLSRLSRGQSSFRSPLSRRAIDGFLSMPMQQASAGGRGEVKVPGYFFKNKLLFIADYQYTYIKKRKLWVAPAGVGVGLSLAFTELPTIICLFYMYHSRNDANQGNVQSHFLLSQRWTLEQDGRGANNTSSISHSISSLALTASCASVHRFCSASDLSSLCTPSNGSHHGSAIWPQILQYARSYWSASALISVRVEQRRVLLLLSAWN